MALSPGDTFTRGDYNYTVDYVDNSYAYLAATVADKTKSSYANLSSFTYSGMNCIVDSMNNCYAGCENLTNPPTVPSTIFGMNGCFEGCTALTSAPSIPSGVVDMSNAFKGCSSLTSVPNIPERTYESTHGYNYDFLMGSCFEGCTSLVTAPTINVSSCTVYMAQCYWGCTSIRTVSSLPKVSHMAYCFANCSSLVSAPSIPSTVFNMEYCFSGCSVLASSPSIPSSVNFIEGLFDGCSSLSSAPALPNVLNLNRCFRGCTSLTSAPTIPSSVTKMDECFRGCTSLATASTIPSSVDSMLDTFYGCSALAGNIVIHSDGANITNTLFYGTVEDIYLVTDTAPFWKNVANQYSNVHLRCASATSAPTLSATSKRVENGSTTESELGEYAYLTVTPTLDTEDWYGNQATMSLSVDGAVESVTWYDSSDNAASYMQTGQTYHTWVDTGDLLSHTLSFSATDSTEHTSSPVTLTFAQAFALMSFKAGGTGAAVGTYATEDNFTVALPANFVGNDTDNPTGLAVRGQVVPPTFYYATKPSESDLPVTPCIVIQTSDWSIWYADGTDYHQLNRVIDGDTTTYGTMHMMASTIDRDGTLPSSEVWERRFAFRDVDNEEIGQIRVTQGTNGSITLRLRAFNENTSGTEVSNDFNIIKYRDGTNAYSLTDPAAFRSAISAAASSHSHSYLPLSGGTVTGNLTVNGSISALGGGTWAYAIVVLTPAGTQQVTCLTWADSYMEARTSNHGNYGISWWWSDKRMKEDIEDSKINALELVNAIPHRQFTMDGTHYDIGYVAQELEELDPQMVIKVAQTRDVKGDAYFTGDYRYQVDERKVIPYLSKAIQELSAENEELKAKNAELEERLAAIERKLRL